MIFYILTAIGLFLAALSAEGIFSISCAILFCGFVYIIFKYIELK